MDGKQHQKGTGVFFPPGFQNTISDAQPTAGINSSSSSAPGCGLLFSSKQHAISAQWPDAVRGPTAAATARPAATPPKRQQANVKGWAAAGPQPEFARSNASQTEAHRAYSSSLGLQAARSTSSDSSSSSSCCSSTFAASHAADAGLWGAASSTAQPSQPPSSSQHVHILPAMSDGLAVSGVDVWSDERGGLPATMWFDVQPDSLMLQPESSAHSLSWASHDNLILLPSLPFDGSAGLSPLGHRAMQGREARPRRSSLLVLSPHPLSPGVPGFYEPASHASAPCLASGSGSLPHEQGWGSPLVGSWALPPQLLGAQGGGSPAPPSLSLLEQQLLLAQGASMPPGMPVLDHTAASAELLTASSPGLVLPLGQHLLHPGLPLEMPAEAAAMPAVGPAGLPAAAQSKLQQLATIEEMKQALERELLDLLRG